MKGPIIQFILGIMVVVLLAVSCSYDEVNLLPEDDVPEGYVSVSFRVDQTDMHEVEARSVDPDGQDIHDMKLFCFNAYGLFLSVVQANWTSDGNIDSGGHHTSGSYTAKIPEETSIIHFIANQNEAVYQGQDFVNKTEAQVLGAMEGGSGMMIYWRRFAKDQNMKDDKENVLGIKEQLSNYNSGTISLIRNQAKVTIKNWDNEYHPVAGYVVTNIHAFGTVAPFCSTHGFAIYEWPITDGHYSVTLPEDKAMMSDITSVNTKFEDYIFEHENTLDNPVSVIIKDTNNKYYRAMIMDENGNMIPILRNHHYVITIKGPMSYGQDSFEKALNAPATNNVWVSVDSWVKEVADDEYSLALKETSKVFHEKDATKAYSFEYTLTSNNGTAITKPEVSWLDGNNVGRHDLVHVFDPATGKGYISVTLLEDNPETPEQTGTLLIRKGRLYRTIDISMISTQKFTPAWISAQVYSHKNSENVTLMFTIPETCPASLFPFSVYISANHLDVRSESGLRLPIVVKGEDDYYGQDWEGIGYKYEYPVTGPGKYRVFMHTLLTHKDGDMEDVHLEANFFETITKTVTFAGTEGKAIFVNNVETRQAHYAYDEDLYYMLVPQKKASPVVLEFALKERVEADGKVSYEEINHANTAGADNDEFLFYSKNFSFYDSYFDNEDEYISITPIWEAQVVNVKEDSWSTNGRVMGLRTYDYKNDGPGLQQDGIYQVYMLTNTTNKQDVVRISSNNKLSKYAFAADRKGSPYGEKLYEGNEYRSFIFDIGYYRPFRFAAQIEVGEGTPVGTILSNKNNQDAEEVVDKLSFTYKPNQKVDIMLDVTSFEGMDGRSVHPFGELFGESFDIYIDAPMLEIDKSRIPDSWLKEKNSSLPADKLRKDPNVEGRFIYTVEKTREAEKSFWSGSTTLSVKNIDVSTKEYDAFGRVVSASGIDQTGERKLLPFVKSSIAVKGDIVISSDASKVVFWEKRFDVSTQKITGTIQYNDGTDTGLVLKDAFVAFVHKLTRARIGSINVFENGKYELNLRSEYDFNWTDEIEFDCKINGEAYEYTGYGVDEDFKNLTLEYLFEHPDVTLVKATKAVSK